TGNTATATILQQTLKEINSPYIKASYDPGNVQFYEGIAADSDFPSVIDQTYSLVAKDHEGEQANRSFPIPGEGEVNFLSIFQQLRNASSFSGNIYVERVDGMDNYPIKAEILEARITKARSNLKRMLHESGFDIIS